MLRIHICLKKGSMKSGGIQDWRDFEPFGMNRWRTNRQAQSMESLLLHSTFSGEANLPKHLKHFNDFICIYDASKKASSRSKDANIFPKN